jgi:hypothetical protein
MTVIKKTIGSKSVLISNYGKNFLSIEDIFDLESDELSLFLKKKKDAPVGNLREIYHTQSNRGLISKVAREMLFIVMWEILEGKSFYLPGSRQSKIFVSAMDQRISSLKRSFGKFKNMNLYMSDFKVPQIQLYTSENKRKYNMCVYVNNYLYSIMHEKLNDTGKVGGKIPFRLSHILPHLYDMFSYIEKDSIKLICNTFFRRLKIISKYGCDLVIKDRHNIIKFFNPVSPTHYKEVSEIKKDFILIKLKQDKIKNFPCHKQLVTTLVS